MSNVLAPILVIISPASVAANAFANLAVNGVSIASAVSHANGIRPSAIPEPCSYKAKCLNLFVCPIALLTFVSSLGRTKLECLSARISVNTSPRPKPARKPLTRGSLLLVLASFLTSCPAPTPTAEVKAGMPRLNQSFFLAKAISHVLGLYSNSLNLDFFVDNYVPPAIISAFKIVLSIISCSIT